MRNDHTLCLSKDGTWGPPLRYKTYGEMTFWERLRVLIPFSEYWPKTRKP
jgi:hypothetical protein